ncbi:alanine--tRNA ligase, mitochondrial isoform X2 [Colletes gigas]|uniref:alanine--tRNA ligase, mitochondrial isoform X2 n=1 Tax=Colletes gigas TaxID=935657 RepID=UPI001C9ACF65|nr:alanine--tRNA ligase, mitochondrial isoform X2 [Colletes gigas]
MHFYTMNSLLLIRPYSSSTSNTIKKSAKSIRNEFLNYFKKDLGHTFIRSSPVTPLNDQTIAFVNAGMNQFKGIFLDYYDPPTTKVVNSQKCIRISGKHNDLNIVGNDTYHHTFFEMLGNWSFGDYFKKEACCYAWDLLTKHYGIKEDCLYVTYFGGNEELGLKPDLECKDIWLSIGVSKDKVLPFGMQDNFWEMGISGPCGPCTEIHVDHTKQIANQSMRINKGYTDLTELWNIVFIQYERLTDSTIVPLSKQYVDTGMGFERLVSLLQEKKSNYDTDIFQPLFKAIQKFAKTPEYKGQFHNDESKLDSGYRILADHSRMITVALADGMIPEESNKLRKIIRKAIDIGENTFKKQGILLELSYAVADSLGDVYPELQTNLKKVQKIIEFEEDSFKRLQNTCGKDWKKMVEIRPDLVAVTDWMSFGLLNGYKYLQHTLKDLKDTKVLSGDVAFNLHDSYGLSAETIRELANIESLHFDEKAFQDKLQNLRYRSKIGLEKSSETLAKKIIELLEKNQIPKTDDTFKYEYVFNGNNCQFPTIASTIVGLIVNGNLILNRENEITNEKTVSNIQKKIVDSNTKSDQEDEIGIILDKTLCYSMEGGQTSDNGIICIKDLIFNIINVRKINDYVIHFGKFAQSDSKYSNEKLKVGDSCVVSINPEVRIGIMQHHTGAHLLNASLKQIMQAVYSRNSHISSHVLKLQFNSFKEKLTFEQLKKIENNINSVIQADVPVTTKIVNSLELLSEDFITLIPGEIYPYTGIRIVEIYSNNLKSKEACCGTHVPNTGLLKHFCLLNYFSKGSANLNIKAAVGSFAMSAKLEGENVQRKILNLEQKLKTEKLAYDIFKTISQEIKNDITNDDRKTPIPYLIKEECLTKLNDLNKNAWVQAKEIEKKLRLKCLMHKYG